MKKLLIDTNIVIDFWLKGTILSDSAKLFSLADKKQVKLTVSL